MTSSGLTSRCDEQGSQRTARLMSDKSDRVLVRRAKAGEINAFDVLVEKYQNRILHLAARYVSDQAAVHDIAQETFISAWRGLGGFHGRSQFYTWLFRIAVNTSKNYLAKQRRRKEQPLPGDEEDGPSLEESLPDYSTPLQEVEAADIEAAVNKAISELSEELRVAITLRELELMSYDEIAYIMKCPVGTVRSRIFRAREVIDEKIRPLLEA